MTEDDGGGRGSENPEFYMTSYVNAPINNLRCRIGFAHFSKFLRHNPVLIVINWPLANFGLNFVCYNNVPNI